MKSTQRFAKGLSKELLEFHSKCSNLWDVEVRNQVHLLCTELGEFVKPDKRGLSIGDNGVVVGHGRMAYELTKGLVAYLESKELTGTLSVNTSKNLN